MGGSLAGGGRGRLSVGPPKQASKQPSASCSPASPGVRGLLGGLLVQLLADTLVEWLLHYTTTVCRLMIDRKAGAGHNLESGAWPQKHTS